MKWSTLYKSLFAILRIDTTITRNNAKVVGTGFIINKNPLYIVTCNHVVSEANQNNNGRIIYSIIKRSDQVKEFDLRQGQISYLKAEEIFHKPEYDIAVLKINPSLDITTAKRLGIPNEIKSLKFDFRERTRDVGLPVEWISAGVLGDLTLTPRFFKGNIVTKYITNHGYKFNDSDGNERSQIMNEVKILEIDQLFLPGCSGSPVISLRKKRVIAYVHGFNSWPILTNTQFKYGAEISDTSGSRNVSIKSKVPLTASLSLAVDVRNIKDFLDENNFI